MANQVEFISVDDAWDEMDELSCGEPPLMPFVSSKYQYSSTGAKGHPLGYSGELLHVSREKSQNAGNQLRSVPEDQNPPAPKRADVPAGERLFQFFKLVRVGTEISTASTEIVSNISPSRTDDETEQNHLGTLSESSTESPASSRNDVGTADRSIESQTHDPVYVARSTSRELEHTPVFTATTRTMSKGEHPLCQESPGDCNLTPIHLGTVSSVRGNDTVEGTHSQGETLIEITTENDSSRASSSGKSERVSGDSISHDSNFHTTNRFIRRERIQRNVKMIGKMLHVESVDADDEVSCTPSQMTSQVIDLTMHEEEQVLLCLLSSDESESSGVYLDKAQTSIANSSLTMELGRTRVGSRDRSDETQSPDMASRKSTVTVPSMTSSLSMGSSSIEFWRSSMSTQDGREYRFMANEKNERYRKSSRSNEEMSQSDLSELLSNCLAPNRPTSRNRQRIIPGTYDQTPPVTEIKVPLANLRRQEKNCVEETNTNVVPSNCSSANESGRSTPQSFFGWSFRSNFFSGNDSSTDEASEEGEQMDFAEVALLRPECDQPDSVQESETQSENKSQIPSSPCGVTGMFRNLWNSSSTIEETAGAHLAASLSLASPTSSVVSPLAPLPMRSPNNIPVESAVDEEDPCVNNTTPVRNHLHSRDRHNKGRKSGYPTLWYVLGSFFFFLLMMGLISLILVGLELAGNDSVENFIQGIGGSPTTAPPTPSPSPSPSQQQVASRPYLPEQDIFDGRDRTPRPVGTQPPVFSPSPTRSPTQSPTMDPTVAPTEGPTAVLLSRTSAPTVPQLETNATAPFGTRLVTLPQDPTPTSPQPKFLWGNKGKGDEEGHSGSGDI